MNRKTRRCCGIDVHKASLSACIRLHGRGRKVSEEIRTFGTTSDELLALHDCLFGWSSLPSWPSRGRFSQWGWVHPISALLGFPGF